MRIHKLISDCVGSSSRLNNDATKIMSLIADGESKMEGLSAIELFAELEKSRSRNELIARGGLQVIAHVQGGTEEKGLDRSYSVRSSGPR